MVDLNAVSIDKKGGLLDRLGMITDRRMRRGIRHIQLSVLAIAICAVLSGSRSFVAIGDWAADLSQDLLERLRCRWSGKKRKFIPPSDPTIRRMLKIMDPVEVAGLLENGCRSNAREKQ